MNGARWVASPELKDAVLAALLKSKSETGEVAAADVRRAAEVLQCSERTIWRWAARNEVPRVRRAAWEPDDHQRERMRRLGSISALHEEMTAQGLATVTVRTMQRGFERTEPAALRVFARQGFHKARGSLPTSAMPDRELNDEWSMDDAQLPVWCVLPDGTIGKPSVQGIREACTRVIVSFNISPHAFSTEDAVENLVTAIAGHYTDNGVFIGGKPRALRTDRGSIFMTRATSLGLVAEEIGRHYSEAYTPQQNGGIENWHRTYKRLFRTLPGFDWTAYKEGDPAKRGSPRRSPNCWCTKNSSSKQSNSFASTTTKGCTPRTG